MNDYAFIIKNAPFFAMALSTISCVFSLLFILSFRFQARTCTFLRKHALLYYVAGFHIEEISNMLYYKLSSTRTNNKWELIINEKISD